MVRPESNPNPQMTGLEVMQDIHHRNPDVEIRDFQVDALDAISANEQAGRNATLIVMAPGLGKTTVMAADARRKLVADPHARIIFLNDSNEILAQAEQSFRKLVGNESTFGLFNGDGREFDAFSVLFASFQVMRKWRSVFLRDEFQYGIVDESHHSSAPTYKPTLDYLNFRHLLGATATPDRMDVLDIRDIFGPEQFSLPLEEAIAKRHLAAVDYHVITDDIAESGVVVDEYGLLYDFKELNRHIFIPKRDEEIVRLIESHAEGLKKVKRIIFCSSIEQAERYAAMFESAQAVHSNQTRKEQRKHIRDFREDITNTVITVDVFNEGIDIPDATQIVLLRETGSKRIFLQQMGRGLRRTPTKKRVQVLDFTGNIEHLLLVDRVWRDVAKRTGAREDELEVEEIDVNTIHFADEARRILPILRRLADRVYDPAQQVPEGSVRLGALATRHNTTPAAIRTIMKQLRIEPEIFPTKRGKEIPYVRKEDAYRIELTLNNLFS